MTHRRPQGLTDDQLRTLLAVTRALSPRHRCWLLATVVAELEHTAGDLNRALNVALERLGREAAA